MCTVHSRRAVISRIKYGLEVEARFPYEEEVLQEVAEDPSLSVRRIEESTGIPKSTAHRILQRAEMHPFHVQRVQSLLPRDYPERISFCRTMLHRHNENPQFIQKILWSDESTLKKKWLHKLTQFSRVACGESTFNARRQIPVSL